MRVMVTIDILGTPCAKGSPQVVTRGRGGVPLPFPRVLHDSPRSRSWATEVASQAALAMCGREPFAGVPLVAELEFRFVRPAGHLGKRGLKPSAPPWPSVKPDIDKLVRNTLDPLHGILIDDDARIVDLRARKVYAATGEGPGCHIALWRADFARDVDDDRVRQEVLIR